MTLFVGPIAQDGGPAIRNSLTIKYLSDDEINTLNTHSKSLGNRVRCLVKLLLSRDDQIIVAVSSKGRLAMWPILLMKHSIQHTKYSLVCIGGTVAEEAARHPWYMKVMARASLVAVQTSGIKDKLSALGFPGSYVMVNFVEDLQKRARVTDLPVGPVKFVFLSSVRNAKGIATMLKAFEDLQLDKDRAILNIFGPIRSDFDMNLFADLGEGISYNGAVEKQDVLKVLSEHTVFVFPSEYSGEGFPTVLAEAMSCGLPVIASDICYNSEIVKHGQTGLIFQSGDANGLKEAMGRYCNDTEFLKACSVAAREESLQYDAREVIGAYAEELRSKGWTI